MNIFRQLTANNIGIKEYPFLKELAMEAYLIENDNILQLDESNFSEPEILDAEIALTKGRKTSNTDGRIDILAKFGSEYLAIVELKLREIDETALRQLEDYLDQKNQILEMDPDKEWQGTITPKWVGILVGGSINGVLQQKMKNGYKYGDIPIGAIVLRRFRGDGNEIFVISDTYFKYQYSSKDYSKFNFLGKDYNKARLVNAVLKIYVANHPDTTFADLERLFPKTIQGSLGVFISKEEAEKIFSETGYKRHYLKPDEIIKIKDAEIATCTQWNPYNIAEFIKKAQENGMAITQP